MQGKVAIIPARGGSKRIPRKNVVDFFGRPLLAWTIDAALESHMFEKVVVSTDDEEIAGIARAYGAETPFLRKEFNDDHATISQVTLHALASLVKLGWPIDVVAMLQATCPLRTASEVVSAVNAFSAADADFQISCFQLDVAASWWAFKRREDGTAEYQHPDMIGRRSQDLPPAYGITGAICIAKARRLEEAGTFYGPGVRFEPVSRFSAIDIDDEDDLLLANAAQLVRLQHAAGKT